MQGAQEVRAVRQDEGGEAAARQVDVPQNALPRVPLRAVQQRARLAQQPHGGGVLG